MELLNSGKKQKEIAEIIGASLNVVKKVSQVKNIREKFYLMNLDTDEEKFLDDMWLDIVYLKDADNKDDIKDIIQLLKSLDGVNRDNIELAITAVECKKENTEDLNCEIEYLESCIQQNKGEYRETATKLKKPRELIRTSLNIIDSYDDSKKELFYELTGIRKSWRDDSYKELCLRRSLDSKLFFKLKKKGVIYHYTSYTEIVDLKAFLDAVSYEPDVKLGYRMKYIQELSENVLDIELSEIMNKRKELEKKKRDFKKELIEIKKLSPVDFIDEAIKLKCRLIEIKECIAKKHKLNEETIARIKEELTKSVKEECIVVDNFINVENANFLIHTKNKNIIFVAYNKFFYDLYCNESKFIQNKIKGLSKKDFDNIVKKASKCANEIYFGCIYFSLDKIESNQILSSIDREKIEYEIYRKFNKEFLFL